MQKTFRQMVVAAGLVLVTLWGVLWLVHWSKLRTLNSGEVHVRVEPESASEAASAPAASNRQPSGAEGATPQQEIAANGVGSNSDSDALRPRITSLPASEAQPRNPPNGLVAAGTGRFQLYRQGDLTYRLNTETGQACVLLATGTMWRRPLVYDHGCANR